MNNLNVNTVVIEEKKVSKQTRAIEIVEQLMSKSDEKIFPARKTLMDLFKSQLQMSDAGSSTYVANIKKMLTSSDPSIKVVAFKKSEKVKKTVDLVEEVEVIDDRIMYSMCWCVDDEIVYVSSSYEKKETKNLQPSDEIVNKFGDKLTKLWIEGNPESDSKSEVKKNHNVIRIR